MPILELDKEALEGILPHRGPALKIDKVIYNSDTFPDAITARKVIYPDDPDLVGHLPGNPIYPGHALLECCYLAGAALIKLKYLDLEGEPRIIEFCKDGGQKRPILVGDTIEISVQLVGAVEKRGIPMFTFNATVFKKMSEGTLKGVAEVNGFVGAAVKTVKK